MELKPISNNNEHQILLDWIDVQFEAGVQKGTSEGNLLEIGLMLIKDYEDKFFPVPTLPKKSNSTLNHTI